jgi:acyl-CoA-dependent ceramide synthase
LADLNTGLAVNLLVLLALTHMSFPRARRHTRKFFELSYYNEETGEYRAGWNDAWMVSFYIVVFTGLRAAAMDYILMPLAAKGGVKSKRDLTRFGEQAWLLIYYTVFWTLGMVRPLRPIFGSHAKKGSIFGVTPTTGST